MILNVIVYDLGLITLSQSNLLKFDRVQNEAMRVILGTTRAQASMGLGKNAQNEFKPYYEAPENLGTHCRE